MDNVLKIKIRSVYGRNMAYPANDVAHKFAKIFGTKTSPRETLAALKDIGYVIEAVAPQAVL